jgi:GNAT superfamily N-acetyltransferase
MSSPTYGVYSDKPPEFTFKTYRIDPLSPNFAFLTGKYAAISLAALTTDPKSFGMAYHTEASFAPSQWAQRLSRPNVHVFICVAHPPNLAPELHTIEHGVWCGMVTQIQSRKSIYWLPETGADEPLEDALETHWHQTATWIDPAYRGKGVAKQLIETGVAYAADTIKGSVQQARVRAFTTPHNEASKKLYFSRGFPAVGLCTVREAITGNGNADYGLLGRWDWPDEIMKRRLGVVMEKVVKKEVVSNGV